MLRESRLQAPSDCGGEFTQPRAYFLPVPCIKATAFSHVKVTLEAMADLKLCLNNLTLLALYMALYPISTIIQCTHMLYASD